MGHPKKMKELVRHCKIVLNKARLMKKKSYKLPVLCRGGHPRGGKDLYACEARMKKKIFDANCRCCVDWSSRGGKDQNTCEIGLNKAKSEFGMKPNCPGL